MTRHARKASSSSRSRRRRARAGGRHGAAPRRAARGSAPQAIQGVGGFCRDEHPFAEPYDRFRTLLWSSPSATPSARCQMPSSVPLVSVTTCRTGDAAAGRLTLPLLLRQSPDKLAYLRDAPKLTADAEVAQIAHLKTDKRVRRRRTCSTGRGGEHRVGAAASPGVLDLHLGPDRGCPGAGGGAAGHS